MHCKGAQWNSNTGRSQAMSWRMEGDIQVCLYFVQANISVIYSETKRGSPSDQRQAFQNHLDPADLNQTRFAATRSKRLEHMNALHISRVTVLVINTIVATPLMGLRQGRPSHSIHGTPCICTSSHPSHRLQSKTDWHPQNCNQRKMVE